MAATDSTLLSTPVPTAIGLRHLDHMNLSVRNLAETIDWFDRHALGIDDLVRAEEDLVAVDEPAFFPLDRDAAAFFSDINVISGTVKGALTDTAFGQFLAPGHPDGTEVDIIFRPQHVKIDFDRGGRGPNPTPIDCSHQVIRIVTMVPKAMISPWAKLAKTFCSTCAVAAFLKPRRAPFSPMPSRQRYCGRLAFRNCVGIWKKQY